MAPLKQYTVTYAEHQIPLECDIYEAEDYPPASPVVLFFHSGGLVAGGRKDVPPWLVQASRPSVTFEQDSDVDRLDRLVWSASGRWSARVTAYFHKSAERDCSRMQRPLTGLLGPGRPIVNMGPLTGKSLRLAPVPASSWPHS